jgi:putative Ca2+/H+ antiporter (TMEM165/GDT1 family)
MKASVIAAVFAVIFLAELGDKTQLVLLTMGARLPWRQVLAGAASAFFLLDLAAVAAGAAFYRLLPLRVLQLAAGTAMLLFGLLTLLRKEKDEEKAGEGRARGPFAAAFLMIMLMELGDKTQLSMMALAARYGSPFSVFLGGTLALWSASALAVLLGGQLQKVLPADKLRPVAGVVFVVFGLAMLMGIA